MSDKKIVNSWNEWDPLKHVIVGRADGCCIPAPEPALDAKVPEDSDMKGTHGPRLKDTVDKANQLLDDFSEILKKRGIKVDRPTPLKHNQKISTPDWEVESMFGCMPARDILLTVGNEILEFHFPLSIKYLLLAYSQTYFQLPSQVLRFFDYVLKVWVCLLLFLFFLKSLKSHLTID